jgi:tetratricopeptide (TPR) repeat protein
VERGYVLLFQHDVATARLGADKALSLDPKSPRVALLQAFVAKRERRYGEQFAQARRVVETTTDTAFVATAYSLLADVYERRAEWDAAEDAHRSVLYLTGSTLTNGRYLEFLVRRNGTESPIAWARRIVDETDGPVSRGIVADVIAAKAASLIDGKHSTHEIRQLLDEGERASSRSADVWYVRGREDDSWGNVRRARVEYETALRLQPNHANTKKALSELR